MFFPVSYKTRTYALHILINHKRLSRKWHIEKLEVQKELNDLLTRRETPFVSPSGFLALQLSSKHLCFQPRCYSHFFAT